MQYLPVCGSDGQTYQNLCVLKASACRNNKVVTVVKNGACSELKDIRNATNLVYISLVKILIRTLSQKVNFFASLVKFKEGL